ncbi:MAG: S-layer homology domain-containing protein [Oscillospiraceae bacterium]|nr:S-layer homology domain-containing protein [Oscillospiraceae bacterium]
MKRITSALLALLLTAALSLTAFAADGVDRTTASFGDATATIIYIDMTEENRAIVPLIANDSISTSAPATSIISEATNGTVVAAINGGFFDSYYDVNSTQTVASGNYPQVFSTILSDGKMICAGGDIAAIGMDYNGDVYLDLVKLSPTITLRGNETVTAQGVNTVSTDPDAIYILTDCFNYPVNIPAASTVVTIQDNIVTSVANGRTAYRNPDDVITLVYGSNAYATAANQNALPVVGDSAVYHYAAAPSTPANTSAWNNMRTVIGGGGILVKDGKSMVDHSINPTDNEQLPDVPGQRSFVAKLNDGRLMLGTVYASFRTIADSLISMGACDAIFMDGGASSALYCDETFITTPGRKLTTMLAVVDEPQPVRKPATPAPTTPNGASSWAQPSVDFARSLGILPTHLDNNYTENITRKEFCDLIANFIRVKTGSTPEDTCKQKGLVVSAQPYSDSSDTSIPYISALGIVTGYPDGTFRPNDSIKRQDAAIMLQRLATLLEASPAGESLSFTDATQISAYAKPGVDYVTSLKIMNGNANGTFAPLANITREQAVITMVNAYNNIQ